MKFAHLSDCHIGGWRETSLRELGIRSFEKALHLAIEEHVGFVLIAGDLFDTALPQIELIKETASILSTLKEEDIPVYIIPGSHDYSSSGKTMLDVLEKAGLVTNVSHISNNELTFTHDRTGTKITGFHGRKGQLERFEYEKINFEHLGKEPGFKIFMFHSLLNEMKGEEFKNVEAATLDILPKGFAYYAGGHPHFVKAQTFEGYGLVAYPGPTFPNNFKELEELHFGGFYIGETNNEHIHLKYIQLKIKEVHSSFINAQDKTPKQVELEILETLQDVQDKIITLRIEGKLKNGKPNDIDFKKITQANEKAYFFMKNTYKLTAPEQEETTNTESTIEDIERTTIHAHLSNTLEHEEALINKLILLLDKEKRDGEKNQDYEQRILKETLHTLRLEDV